MSKVDKHKIRTILRKEMKKLPNDKQMKEMKSFSPFSFCFSQARFDILMDIDRELQVGAFFKINKKEK